VSDLADADEFASAIARRADEIDAGFALLFFSRELMDAEGLATALTRHAPDLDYAGCSTAGEITPTGLQEGQVMAILFPRRNFTAVSAMVRNLAVAGMEDIAGEVEKLRRNLYAQTGSTDSSNVFALCLIDGLSFAEEAVISAIHWGLDDIPLVGGSAGDDLKFETTELLSNGCADNDCAVVILISTSVPFHVFKTENFLPTDKKLVVTAAEPDKRLVHEFNASVAAEEFASAIGIANDALTPLSFASHPIVVRVGGEYYCRSIRKMHADGSLSFFCAIDDGIVLSIAESTGMVETTRTALKNVDEKLGGIDVVLGFDCVLRRLDARNRQVFRDISELYSANNVIGFGTYGEQYRSMHLSQTLVGIAFGHTQAIE